MTNHRDALSTPQNEALTRWTRPIIREWDGMTGTEGGSGPDVTETVNYYDPNEGVSS